MKISAAIITFNEERNIRRCLESLEGVADEVIVIDSFSSDATKSICQEFDVTFLENPFKGHIQQKNFALGLCSHDYVLSLDADESLDEVLKKSILEVKKKPKHKYYKMNRLTNYCGDWIKHGSWYPDTKLRLARKDLVIWGGENPHDKLMPLKKGKVKHLAGDILHYSYYSVEEHLIQQEKFSTIAAEEMYNRGKKAPWYKLVANPVASVIKDLILNKGFLDGKSGFKVAEISAKSVFWKYKKLRDMWETN